MTPDFRERTECLVKVVRLFLDKELHGDITRRLYKEVTWEATELGRCRTDDDIRRALRGARGCVIERVESKSSTCVMADRLISTR